MDVTCPIVPVDCAAISCHTCVCRLPHRYAPVCLPVSSRRLHRETLARQASRGMEMRKPPAKISGRAIFLRLLQSDLYRRRLSTARGGVCIHKYGKTCLIDCQNSFRYLSPKRLRRFGQ